MMLFSDNPNPDFSDASGSSTSSDASGTSGPGDFSDVTGGSSTTAPTGGKTYIVKSGDSLSKIGSKYGIPWQAIWDANRDILHDPDKIYPGQELKIPS